jgi:hypothetical protein
MGASRPIILDRPVVGPEIPCQGTIDRSLQTSFTLTISTVVKVKEDSSCVGRLDGAPHRANNGEKADNVDNEESGFDPREFAREEGDL